MSLFTVVSTGPDHVAPWERTFDTRDEAVSAIRDVENEAHNGHDNLHVGSHIVNSYLPDGQLFGTYYVTEHK